MVNIDKEPHFTPTVGEHWFESILKPLRHIGVINYSVLCGQGFIIAL